MIASLSLQPQMEVVDTAVPLPLLCPFPCSWRQNGDQRMGLAFSTATSPPREVPERRDYVTSGSVSPHPRR